MSDTESSDLLSEEPPTLYQLIRRHKRNATRLVRSVRDGKGNIQTSPSGIAKTFTRFFQAKYAKIEVDPESVQTLATLIQTDGFQATGMEYEAPFTQSEILKATNSGGHNRAPGRDGLGLGFYKATWAVIREDLGSILIDMFFEGTITAQQKQGIIVCLSKAKSMLTPEDRRPITLLNTDYNAHHRTATTPHYREAPKYNTILWSTRKHHIRRRGYSEGHHCLRGMH
jgi:hypothetical protein